MKWSLPAKTTRNRLIGIVGLGVFAAAGWYWYSAAAQSPRDSLQAMGVRRGTIEELITAQGKLDRHP